MKKKCCMKKISNKIQMNRMINLEFKTQLFRNWKKIYTSPVEHLRPTLRRNICTIFSWYPVKMYKISNWKVYKMCHCLTASVDNRSIRGVKYNLIWEFKIVAKFRGMHVLPAKHSYAWLPRKCDYTDRWTDRPRQSDPYVPLCFAGDTKTMGNLPILSCGDCNNHT